MLEKDELLPWLIKTYECHFGIEVGVCDGSNARNLLEKTDIVLLGVDIIRYPSTEQLVREYSPRFSMLYQYSIEAAKYFMDQQFDIIYLDADHRYENIYADLRAWYPKLVKGGIFCGDDYCNCWNPQEGQYEVVRAVEEFIADKNVQLNISGLGEVAQTIRMMYADRIGKLHEDNFTGRNRTEGVPVPQWWFIKED